MAHFQNQYGAVEQIPGYDEDTNRQVDEYGNPVVQTDAYGNPVHHTAAATTTSGVYGTTGMRGHGGAHAAGTGLGGGLHGLHRSGSSSSSSSSEDDGRGGRRRKKKGLKEKIKEKLPGVGHRDESSQISATTTPGGYNVTGEGLQLHHQQHHEKKGVVEKIKEKLPGHHHHHHQ